MDWRRMAVLACPWVTTWSVSLLLLLRLTPPALPPFPPAEPIAKLAPREYVALPAVELALRTLPPEPPPPPML
jgi:hypothetical protein